MARLTSIRTLLAVAVTIEPLSNFFGQLNLYQMDVKNAFLNWDISKEIYMCPLLGFLVSAGKVCRLRRASYGLKQVPKTWSAKFSFTIASLVFSKVLMILPYLFAPLVLILRYF